MMAVLSHAIGTQWLRCSAQSDAFYVPAKGRMTFALGAAAFEGSGLSHEIVVPNLLGMVTEEDGLVDKFNVEYMLEASTRQYEVEHMEEFLTPLGHQGRGLHAASAEGLQ